MVEPPGGGQGMTTSFEYKGVWFLPENPDKQVAGTLKFSPTEGAILELIGSFKGIEKMNQLTEQDIILGYCGKRITLYECREIRSQIGTDTVQSSNFYAQAVFLDVHFQKKEDVKFKKLAAHYLHLDEWVYITGFEIFRPTGVKGITVNYTLPNQIPISEYEGCKIAIEIKATGPTLPPPQRELKIKEKTFITIESPEEKPFEEHMKMADRIQNLLSLAAINPSRPEILYGYTKAYTVEKENVVIYPAIEAVMRLAFPAEAQKPLMPHEMLFNYSDIKEKTNTVFQNWLKKQKNLKPVFDLYFSTLYNPHLDLENEFLNIVQALESYHRRTMKNYDLPENEHKKRVEAILNGTPQEHKEWLVEGLEYSNEPRLRKRLEEILEQISDATEKTVQGSKSFIQKVIDTRNYLTHYDEKLKGKAAIGQKLYRLTLKLKMLLEIVFLKELGLQKESIKSLIERNVAYERIIKDWAQERGLSSKPS